MNLQFFVFLGLFYTVSSLQCETGADLSAGFFSSLAMSTQECMNPESSCIRIDLEIVLFGFQQGEREIKSKNMFKFKVVRYD